MYRGPIYIAFRAIANLFKADIPPDWWQDSQRLKALLSGSWQKVTKDFSEQIQAAILARDIDRLEDLLTRVDELGIQMSTALGNQPEALFSNLQSKAMAAWSVYGTETLAIQRIQEFDGDYQRFLATVHAEQVKAFTQAHPGRILHPEIVRQVNYLRDSDLIRSIDLNVLAERVGRVIQQRDYWEGLSDVHVARIWHSDGILLASENGVVEIYITGPDDKKTCPVCQRMIGQSYRVDKAKAKIKRDIGITDPDEYVKAWPFPRVPDVDNISEDELRKKLYLPPYHGRCRHGIAWST